MPNGLHTALLAVQAEAPTLPKNATNPHFKSRYCPLDTVVETMGPILTKHGLTWITMPSANEDGPTLRYQLTHAESSEAVVGEMPLLLSKNDPQGQGAAITYARRYALQSVLNIVADEDVDGNDVQPTTSTPKRKSPTSKPTAAFKAVSLAQATKIAERLASADPLKVQLVLAKLGVAGDPEDSVLGVVSGLTVEQGQQLLAEVGA